MSATGRGGTSKLSLALEEGQVYFVWLDAQTHFPFGPLPQLNLVDASQGAADLKRCSSCEEATGVPHDASEIGGGGQQGSPRDDARTKLQALKQMFDDGLITKDEYDAKRKQVLDAY